MDFVDKRSNSNGRIAPRGSLYRYRMHFFAAAASFFNLLACIDLKGYAARQPLLLTETFNELAFSCVLCVLFHMVNQWVDVITLGGRTDWGKRQHALLPWMCGLVTVLRVGLGLAQWLAVPDGVEKAKYNGTLNALKLLTTFLAVVFYTGIGMYASIYQPMQVKRKRSSASGRGGGGGGGGGAPKAGGGGGSGRETSSSSALGSLSDSFAKKKVMNMYYLVGLFVILFVYFVYLVSEAVERFGEIEQRNVPCSTISKNWFTNQGTIIILVGLYISMKSPEECDPAKGGGCTLPSSPEQRRKRRVLAAKKKQEAVRQQAEKERRAKAAALAAQEEAVERAMMHTSGGDVESPNNARRSSSSAVLRSPSGEKLEQAQEEELAFENPSTVLVDARTGKHSSSLSGPSDSSYLGRDSSAAASGQSDLVEVELSPSQATGTMA